MKTFANKTKRLSPATRGRLTPDSIKSMGSHVAVHRAQIRQILNTQCGTQAIRPKDLGNRTLAVTRDGHTEYATVVTTYPMRKHIETHEAVHRAQFASLGTRPPGTRAQLESEAEHGTRAPLAGSPYTVSYAAMPGQVLAYDETESNSTDSEERPWGTIALGDKEAIIRFINKSVIKCHSHHVELDGTERYGHIHPRHGDGFIVIPPTGDLAYFRSRKTTEAWERRQAKRVLSVRPLN